MQQQLALVVLAQHGTLVALLLVQIHLWSH
jgi:hypothetical protein